MKMRSGFSLIEIVMAIALVALILSVGIPSVMNMVRSGTIKSTHAALHAAKGAIDMFSVDTGSYPNELNDLIERPSDERLAAKWSNPYVEKYPRDGWDHELQYERTPQGAHPYELYSFGANGEGGADEERISVWDL